MTFKFRVRAQGIHVHVGIFAGPDSDHLARLGGVIMREDEAAAFLDVWAVPWPFDHEYGAQILTAGESERTVDVIAVLEAPE